MTNRCRIRMASRDYKALMAHMFPGDHDEHGAVLLCGVSTPDSTPTFYVRELHIARDGSDYVEGKIGYRALSPTFIHRVITRARDEKLAYIAVHNHDSDRRVAFSGIDLDSHELGYPALLQISRGMPVGALVVGHRAAEADMWMPDGRRLHLDELLTVGTSVSHLTAAPRESSSAPEMFDRQVRMFGHAGQERLTRCKVAIVGLGGIGSLVAEYLARLGVGNFVLIDPDRLEPSNVSRVVGATAADLRRQTLKIEVARRTIAEANASAHVATIADDVAKQSVASSLTSADYIFLAADSMRARLIFNAVVHQYLIPGVQLGSKVVTDQHGLVNDAMSVIRPVRPGLGCLWCNQLIDPTLLAIEAKTDEERKAQAYGVAEPNPSVIALNAVSAAHAVNDFMLDYLGIRESAKELEFQHFHFVPQPRLMRVQPRRDPSCSECSQDGPRYGRADGTPLPVIEG
jgi:hypothetical protein